MTREDILQQTFTTGSGKQLQIRTGLNFKYTPSRKDDYERAKLAYSSLYNKHLSDTAPKKMAGKVQRSEPTSPVHKEVIKIIKRDVDSDTLSKLSQQFGNISEGKNPLELGMLWLGEITQQLPSKDTKIKVYVEPVEQTTQFIKDQKIIMDVVEGAIDQTPHRSAVGMVSYEIAPLVMASDDKYENIKDFVVDNHLSHIGLGRDEILQIVDNIRKTPKAKRLQQQNLYGKYFKKSSAIHIKNKYIALQREVYEVDGELVVDHEYFVLDESVQGKGIAKNILVKSMEKYRKMGITKITTYAGDTAGGYVWARFGFKPTQESWNLFKSSSRHRILSRLEKNNAPKNVIEAVNVILDMDDPSYMWSLADIPIWSKLMLKGTDWNGEFNFNDEESIERFNEYTK